jgi:hypothetical protein
MFQNPVPKKNKSRETGLAPAYRENAFQEASQVVPADREN